MRGVGLASIYHPRTKACLLFSSNFHCENRAPSAGSVLIHGSEFLAKPSVGTLLQYDFVAKVVVVPIEWLLDDMVADVTQPALQCVAH